MRTLQLTTPASVGTRDLVRSWLDSATAEDLSGDVIELDCSPLRSVTPSFIDEMLKILVVERHANVVRLVNAADRAVSLAQRSAENRHIASSLEVVAKTERTGLLSRMLR